MVNTTNAAVKSEIERLAEQAFHQRLISGYGDGEFPEQYQIVYQGKPRHFPLIHAYLFLDMLLKMQENPASKAQFN